MSDTSSADTPQPAPPPPVDAIDEPFGLFPPRAFRLTTGRCPDSATIEQALWFFRDETIAVPCSDTPAAGYSRLHRVYDDVARWHMATPIGSPPDAPPLIWLGAGHSIDGARITPDTSAWSNGSAAAPLRLAPRHPLNRAYFDTSSSAFMSRRTVRLRGDWRDGQLQVRTFWPEDFRLPAQAPTRSIASTPAAIRTLVRERRSDGEPAEFSVETLWYRDDAQPIGEGQPVLAFVLNGAQGDDDEAHAGHFAPVIGRIGAAGAMHDWLVANYYSLDSESEKGIIAASVPLDNYLADLNAGQAWYRPSWLLVAVLRDQRTAAHVQSALGRVFNQFYRHQFSYQHARANCAGISVSTLRALGWQIPARGAESWLRAVLGLPLTALRQRSLARGKAAFDYLTEDRTRLYPAAAFEEIGADLLRLATGKRLQPRSEFEAMLADDLDALLFVRIPQLPSSRTTGTFPVADGREYLHRLPKKVSERRIIPVGPRPFPKDFKDPDSPHEPPLRSDYAVMAYGLLCVLLLAWLIA